MISYMLSAPSVLVASPVGWEKLKQNSRFTRKKPLCVWWLICGKKRHPIFVNLSDTDIREELQGRLEQLLS